ncbi:hypothetical protein TeGR_g7905, partial [Tetraparma gracilis]
PHQSPDAASPPNPPPQSSWTSTLTQRKRRNQRVKLFSPASGTTYQLGEKIGKGGSGEVHTALNLDTGEVVAVKTLRSSSSSSRQSAVDALQTEVELLKKLVHPNIVKYVDLVRSKNSLHVVLEYMENGSLRSLCDKFDGFSESLVAIYVTQVLTGLIFLHSQGVLHRDVKGANILTTKDGFVKLADFGVAMTIADEGERDRGTEDTVVGSPYWMAPEIIELQGPTAACDIWSLGCTVIELLTGKPPYMELDPMAALFRIVQDEHPPLPQGISEALTDFLLKCFEKDPSSRISAQDLVSHQWLKNPQSHIKKTEYLLRESEHTEGAGWDSVAQTLHLYARGSVDPAHPDSELLELAPARDSFSFTRSAPSDQAPSQDSKGIAVGALKMLRSLSRGMLGMGGEPLEGNEPKGSPPPPKLSSSSSLDHAGKPSVVSAEEFFLQGGGGDEGLEAADDTEAAEAGAEEPQEDKPEGSEGRADESVDDGGERDGAAILDPPILTSTYSDSSNNTNPSNSSPPSGPSGSPARVRSRSRNRSFNSETINDQADIQPSGFSDIPENEELVDSGPSFISVEALQKEQLIQRTKLSSEILDLVSSLQPGCDESTIVKTCNKMLKIFNDDPELPHHFVMNHGVIPIMELLEVSKLMAESIMGSILSVRSVRVLPSVLQVVNKIIEGNKTVQEHLSLVGMIPVMVKIAEGIYGSINFRGSIYKQHSLHLEAAKFVDQICKTSELTLQMFIAGGGLPLLVRHMQVASDVRKNNDIGKIVAVGIDGILEVFKLQTIRRDDFCHLFVKLGLLPHLVISFRSLLSIILETSDGSVDPDSWAELEKLGEILTFFASSDPFVKERMAVENVCLGILNPFISLSLTKQLNNKLNHKWAFQKFSVLVVVLLKCLRELAAEPNTLKKLDREQAIATLMPLLEQLQPGYDNAMFDEAMKCMYYLCRIDKTRQELAARLGLIQQLQRCMGEDKLHLKEWSFPIICDMAYTSSVTREELWRYDGVLCYLNIMQYPQWRISALNAITVWLANDIERVEPVLTLPNNVEILIKCCVESLKDSGGGGEGRRNFDQICQALLRLSVKSPMLSLVFGRDTIFISHLVAKLEQEVDYSPVSKMCLLKLLGKVTNRTSYAEHGIFPLLAKLAQDESQILISELSNTLMKRIAFAYQSPLKKRGR